MLRWVTLLRNGNRCNLFRKKFFIVQNLQSQVSFFPKNFFSSYERSEVTMQAVVLFESCGKIFLRLILMFCGLMLVLCKTSSTIEQQIVEASKNVIDFKFRK